jgi:uncharacterized glyoxalase superfamily protein PhnB
MPKLDTYRKQAKQLVRWHADRNYSVGGKARRLPRLSHLTDAEILGAPLPLTLAQEIVAAEAGFPDWAALKRSVDEIGRAPDAETPPRLSGAVPILFVRDVTQAAAFWSEKLGFAIDFLHGQPPFYGAVSRDGARLHLRFVHEPNFAALAAREVSLILATIEVGNVKALYAEVDARGADLAQPLTRQAWGGLDFHVRDLDGNVVSFVEYRTATGD